MRTCFASVTAQSVRLFRHFCVLYKRTQHSTAAWSALGKLMFERRAEISTFFERIPTMTYVQNCWQKKYYTSFDTLSPPGTEFSKDVFWHTLSSEHPNGILISDKSETGREKHVSVPEIVTFLPVQKRFVPAGPKCDVYREGCDKKRHKLKKYFRERERHILPRNVTNVTRRIFLSSPLSDPLSRRHHWWYHTWSKYFGWKVRTSSIPEIRS